MQEYLTKSDSIKIKGISAVLILIHHIVQFTPALNKYYYLNLSYFLVSIFFLISGYGISKSSKDDFIKKRVLKIYLLYLSSLTIYLIIYACFKIYFPIESILKSLYGEVYIVNFCWYIFEIIILYLIYYINYKFLKNSEITLTLLILLFILLLFLLRVDMWWYISTLSFLSGIYLSKNSYKKSLDKYLYLLSIISAIILILSVNKTSSIFKIVRLACNIIFANSFSLIFINILKIFGTNKFLIKLGKISSEIYLMQGLAIKLLLNVFKINNYYIFVPFAIILTFIFSYILYIIFSLIRKKIF